MLARRLEDKIRELCSALPAENAVGLTSQSEATLADLRAAISEYTRRRQNWMTSATLLGPEAPKERRHCIEEREDLLYLLVLRDPNRWSWLPAKLKMNRRKSSK
jgi:hypothetical protein